VTVTLTDKGHSVTIADPQTERWEN